MSLLSSPSRNPKPNPARWMDQTALVGALGFLGLFLILPLVAIFFQAFSKGLGVWWANLSDPETLAALRLTLLTTGIVVPLNVSFGVSASWALAKFQFKGRDMILTLVDLPFSVSPVISGLVFILLFGLHGWFGAWLLENQIQIIFAFPGIVLATLFVTFPFVARELIPLMSEQGTEEEQAALSLGASGWQTFVRVTLPNIRWGLLYGVTLCTARAVGEFGAVSVVSGHIRGQTSTLPIHIEILYNEYNFVGAFAVATGLLSIAGLTVILKALTYQKNQSLTNPESTEP